MRVRYCRGRWSCGQLHAALRYVIVTMDKCQRNVLDRMLGITSGLRCLQLSKGASHRQLDHRIWRYCFIWECVAVAALTAIARCSASEISITRSTVAAVCGATEMITPVSLICIVTLIAWNLSQS